ncbi:MAG: RHS repeat-associated core domain-containing protein, partial [Bacteroidota bacterium]|nr:RHS repeat-associated core domain-containing protein [Bacteroidota bacterium]
YTDGNGNGTVESAEIVEENNYYPFGLKHKGYNEVVSSYGNSVANKWKYQDQELNESFDYNMYEFELRHYDPAIGRFVTTDPYEQFVSPYVAMGNNPVVSFDPNGGLCYDSNGNVIACPNDDIYDDYRDSDENHITILDEAGGTADNRPRMKPASNYDYSDPAPEGKKEDDIDFILNGYETGMDTPIHRFFAILDRDLNADSESQEMVEILTLTAPIKLRVKPKPVSLRSVKKITVDMEHILSGHVAGGSRVSSIKTLFSSSLTSTQIEKMIKTAYSNSKKIQTQGNRVRLRGTSDDGVVIEMWLNKVTNIIETAYPIK